MMDPPPPPSLNDVDEDHQFKLAIQESLKSQQLEQQRKSNLRFLDCNLSEDEQLKLALELSKQESKNESSDEGDNNILKSITNQQGQKPRNKTKSNYSRESRNKSCSSSSIDQDEELRKAIEISKTVNDDYCRSLDQDWEVINVTDSDDNDDLEAALKLSLDPQEQNNREHREFLEFLLLKNQQRDELDRQDEISQVPKEVATSDTKGLSDVLTEDEQLLIALKRSAELDPSPSLSSSYSRTTGRNRVQGGYTRSTVPLPKRGLNQNPSPFSEPKAASGFVHKTGKLRPIIVDGCNVAWAHGNDSKYSALGLKILYNTFLQMGHTDIVIFVRSYEHLPAKERAILDELKNLQVLTVCPQTKSYGSKTISHYDDLMLIEYACRCKGIVVSRDKFRDIVDHSKMFKEQIQNRVLPFVWVGNELILTQDPLGRNGPKLKEFLRY